MPNVLICEDETPLRRIIAINLVRRGYGVAEADSVAAAREALAAWSGTIDVILLDINLPDRTGWDVLRDLRRDATTNEGHAPRVIIVTAVRPPQSHIEKFHPDAVLVKPFPLAALFRLLERMLAAPPLPGDATGQAEPEQEPERESEQPGATWSAPE